MSFRLPIALLLLVAFGCGGGGAVKEKYKDFDTPKVLPTKK